MLIQTFSEENIIKLLCKYRLKEAKKRHKVHMIRDISLHPTTNRISQFTEEQVLIYKMFPPRRKWHRFNSESRNKYLNTKEQTIDSLYTSILITKSKIKKGKISIPDWYKALYNFVHSIQSLVLNNKVIRIEKPKIFPIHKSGEKKCRPISLYDLKCKLIIGLTARYLTETFEDFLFENSYAFKARQSDGKYPNHHDTIDAIFEYKNKHKSEEIYVAEADIRKFFDCVSHELIIKTYYLFVENVKITNKKFDDRASIIFESYLESYAFNQDVYTLNKSPDYFRKFGIIDGFFEWPLDPLVNKSTQQLPYSEHELNIKRIGVPQGGALSCVIANLLLHKIDEMVLEKINRNALYLRYCDDIIIMDTSFHGCNKLLKEYEKGIDNVKLLIHQPKESTCYDKSFWDLKSKTPYKWADNSTNKCNVPWISFVGYQIKFDNSIRVRKASIKKEITKQKKEVTEICNALLVNRVKDINSNSRKSFQQQKVALEYRLISMSVGRVKIYNYKNFKPSFCWSSGFNRLTNNPILESQLKYLDRFRNKNLFKFSNKISSITRKNTDPNSDDSFKKLRFIGTPYSYYGFLQSSIFKNINQTNTDTL
jgi:hypothetical protein